MKDKGQQSYARRLSLVIKNTIRIFYYSTEQYVCV